MQKKAFGSEIIVQNQLRKKSVRVQERSKCVQNRSRLRNILRKAKGFSRSEMAWFRLFTRKSITGRKKAFRLEKPFQSSFFFKMVKTKFFENGLEKTNLEGYQVYEHTHTYIYIYI